MAAAQERCAITIERTEVRYVRKNAQIMLQDVEQCCSELGLDRRVGTYCVRRRPPPIQAPSSPVAGRAALTRALAQAVAKGRQRSS
jgi:hypothetical protein